MQSCLSAVLLLSFGSHAGAGLSSLGRLHVPTQVCEDQSPEESLEGLDVSFLQHGFSMLPPATPGLVVASPRLVADPLTHVQLSASSDSSLSSSDTSSSSSSGGGGGQGSDRHSDGAASRAAEEVEAKEVPPQEELPIIRTNTPITDSVVHDLQQVVFELESKQQLITDARKQASRVAAAELRFWQEHQPAGRALTEEELLVQRVAADMTEALQLEIRSFTLGTMKLFNPSIATMPPHWRRPGERWLATFRLSIYKNQTGPLHEGMPKWYSSFVVLTALDSQLRPLRPLQVLGSRDFFKDPFDCHLDIRGSASLFGPEDGRLFVAPDDDTSLPRVLLFFSARAHTDLLARPCSAKLGQRMFVSELGPDLLPKWTHPILVPGERDVADALDLNETRRQTHSRPTAGLGRPSEATAPEAMSGFSSFSRENLGYVEKNWSPFLYRPQTIRKVLGASGSEQRAWGPSMILAAYSLDPHVVVDIVASANVTRAGSRHVWNTSSPVVEVWKKSMNIDLDTVVHIGVPPVLLQREGRPDVYLSALHATVGDSLWYSVALYTFEAVPPFRVLGIGSFLKELTPLPCLWGAPVAFPMGLKLDLNQEQPELWVLWGRGDQESHRLRLPWARVSEEYLPKNKTGSPGLTLVMMSHSRKRLPDLLVILRKYRTLPPGLLEEIVLIWNDPEDHTTPQEIAALNSEPGLTLRVIPARVNSMNNRFEIWKSLATEGVVIQDDDMWVTADALSQLIRAWRKQPDALVAPFVERDHFVVGETGSFEEIRPTCEDSGPDTTLPNCTFWGDEFTMLLPHPWVVKRDYLRVYMEGRRMVKLVDDMVNCDDIYFNAVVANATRQPPVAVDVPVHRFPRWKDESSMWASDASWFEHRTQCMEAVNAFYAAETLSVETGTVWRITQGTSAGISTHSLAMLPILALATAAVIMSEL